MVVLDEYSQDEARAMHKALRKLFQRGGYDWDSTGVYAFWDPDSREILYIGLDSNLSSRFARHNGLVQTRGGDKRHEVAQWFETHESLGYSVIAQSAAVRILEDMWPAETGKDIIGFGEGQLLEQHVLIHGALPRWNRIGGAKIGRAHAQARSHTMLDLVTGARDSLLVARRSIRALAEDQVAQGFELVLHGARLNACMEGLLSGEGVSEFDIVCWLVRMALEPQWGSGPDEIETLGSEAEC